MIQNELLQTNGERKTNKKKKKITHRIEFKKPKRVSRAANIFVSFIGTHNVSFYLQLSFFSWSCSPSSCSCSASFSTHYFFRTPFLLHLEWVLNQPKKKEEKHTNTNCRRVKCFACIQHATHSNFECKSVVYRTKKTHEHS